MELPAFMVDPNIVYVLTVIGLWIGITAVFMPGTGIAELLAVVVMGASAYLLLNMPTNWLAVIVLISGVISFIIMPFIKQQYAMLAIGGLALQGIGGLFLFTGGLQVSPLVIVFTLAIPWAYHQFILMPLLSRMHSVDNPVMDRDQQVIGVRGRVVKPLDPIGTVLANGELWTATSSENLAENTVVVVVDREGLQLFVEPLKSKHQQNGHIEENVVE